MIRIEVEDTVASGNFTATAYQEGEVSPLCTDNNATRLTAIANVFTKLAALPVDDLELQPITIVTPRSKPVQ